MHEDLIHLILWGITATTAITLTGRALWARRKGRRVKPWLIGAAIAIFATTLVVPAIGVVPAGHRGVVYEWSGGVNASERDEGITFLVPWAQNMRPISVRTQKVIVDKLYAQSFDLQEITVPVSVNYHIAPDKAAELYQTVGPLYPDTVIRPALLQRAKAAIGLVVAENFARSRERLAYTIREQLNTQLSGYGIVIEFVNVEDAIFDKDFIAAVKAKIIAEQRAAEQRRLIAAERAIKQQTIIKAEAEARAVRVKAAADAYANDVVNLSLTPDVLRWKWLKTWDGDLPTTVAGGDTGVLLGIYP